MSAPIVKPYTYLPDYADVQYVDGKLKVARACLAASRTDEQRRRWGQTVDILLDQRNALAGLDEEPA